MRIGILIAYPSELDPNFLKGWKEVKYGALTYYAKKGKRHNVVLIFSGFGKVNATIATTFLIEVLKVNAILNIGSCGANNKKLQKGSIHFVSRAKYIDVDNTTFGYKKCQVPRENIWFDVNLFKVILHIMSKALTVHTVAINEQQIVNKTEEQFKKSKKTAYTIVNNNFYKSNSYYTDYINMRINQFDVIKRMRNHLRKFNMPVEQMQLMGKFTMKVSENVTEINDCKDLLKELNDLRDIFKKMELPKTREEFESRASLLQYLNDMEEFLEIKKNFILGLS